MFLLKPVIGILGHKYFSHPPEKIKHTLEYAFKKTMPDLVLVGVDLGFDLLVMEICNNLNIPYICIDTSSNIQDLSSIQREKLPQFFENAESVEKLQQATNKKKWIIENSDMLLIYFHKFVNTKSLSQNKKINIYPLIS